MRLKSRNALMGFGIFAVIAVLLTYTIWSTLQRSVSGNTDKYTAVFTDVLGLRVGDDIRMAGVRVGRVDDIKRDADDHARVDFEIQRDQHLYANTKAMVRYQNLIGQRYVALAPGEGTAKQLKPGAKIDIAHTEPSFDVSLLLAGFEPLFSVLQPDQVNSLAQTLIQALQGNGVSLSALITQAAALANTFSQRDQILGDVINNLSGVIEGLAHRSDSLKTLITQTQTILTGFYAQGQSLKASVDVAAGATNSLAELVGQVAPGMAQAQNNATTGVSLLLGSGAALDQAAIELPNILNDLARVTSYGTYANAYFCGIDVSLWNVLLPRGLFSQIGGNSHSEVCR